MHLARSGNTVEQDSAGDGSLAVRKGSLCSRVVRRGAYERQKEQAGHKYREDETG